MEVGGRIAGLNVIGGAGGSLLIGIQVPCGFVGDQGWDWIGMVGGLLPPYCAWAGDASRRVATASDSRVETNVFIFELLVP